MSTRVTLALMLAEQRQGKPLYDPAPGTLYEVAPTKFVKMLPPTIERQEDYFEVSQRVGPKIDERTEKRDPTFEDMKANMQDGLEMARVITDGWEQITDEKQLFANVILRIAMDFQLASKPMFQPSAASSDSLSALVRSLDGAMPGGQEAGARSTETSTS